MRNTPIKLILVAQDLIDVGLDNCLVSRLDRRLVLARIKHWSETHGNAPVAVLTNDERVCRPICRPIYRWQIIPRQGILGLRLHVVPRRRGGGCVRFWRRRAPPGRGYAAVAFWARPSPRFSLAPVGTLDEEETGIRSDS